MEADVLVKMSPEDVFPSPYMHAPIHIFFFKLRAEKMAWSVSACLNLDLQHHIKATYLSPYL